MEDCAHTLAPLLAAASEAHSKAVPLKKQLIDHMVSKRQKEVTVGEKKFLLVEKKTKKAVSGVRVLALATEVLGAEAGQALKRRLETEKGEPVTKRSLKLQG
ncbi:hypothetical protein JKP88DRAFT_273041 [Tribonema minus]|uniref:Uncharacterized protein n=1 Tax=Tribonema minus TaxID=303371 RepID=A0A836CE39_9STRA|nr:hypothetical protein JKP88DRAFT_273041 [Tribonema minus]